MSPKRIAHVVEATTGGVARHVMDLITRYDREEFTPYLYCSFERPESWTDEMRRLQYRGIVLREVPMARVPNPNTVRQLAHWAARDAIDLLHAHSAKAGLLGRQAATIAGLPVIYTPHAFPFQRTTDWWRPLYRHFERRMAAGTARIICVSEGERDEALGAGLPAEKLVVIPNGLDLAAWPRPTAAQRRDAREALGVAETEVVIGAMGRLVSQKGIDLLIQAADDVLPDFPEARICIWGDGPQRRQLWRMASRFHLKRIAFLGNTDQPWQAFAAMDIFCSPSRWEAGPYAVLEAMACGVPVVASRVAGHLDYVVAGETGQLVTAEFPGPLAGGLRGLLADADPRQDFGDAARHRVKREFTVERMVQETLALYREVLAETPTTPFPCAEESAPPADAPAAPD